MDRHDAKPRRPSLLAGAPVDAASAEAARPSSARILADMQPAAAARNPAPTRRRAWLAVAGVVVLAAVAGSWMLGDADRPQPRPAVQSAVLVERSDNAMPMAATIIEEPGPGAATAAGAATANADPDAATGTVAEASVAESDTPFAIISGPAATARPAPALSNDNPFATTTAVATSAPAKRPRARATASRTKTDEPDLLAVLLGNIRAGDEGKARDVEGLDALIRSMQTEQDRTATRSPSGAAATDQANGRPLRTRSEQIQSNLRECPPPNTAKGIKCRQAICAVYAGRDPACPAAG